MAQTEIVQEDKQMEVTAASEMAKSISPNDWAELLQTNVDLKSSKEAEAKLSKMWLSLGSDEDNKISLESIDWNTPTLQTFDNIKSGEISIHDGRDNSSGNIIIELKKTDWTTEGYEIIQKKETISLNQLSFDIQEQQFNFQNDKRTSVVKERPNILGDNKNKGKEQKYENKVNSTLNTTEKDLSDNLWEEGKEKFYTDNVNEVHKIDASLNSKSSEDYYDEVRNREKEIWKELLESMWISLLEGEVAEAMPFIKDIEWWEIKKGCHINVYKVWPDGGSLGRVKFYDIIPEDKTILIHK